jgi:hypothetical protein
MFCCSVFVATWKPISQYVAAIMFALIRWIRCLIGDPWTQESKHAEGEEARNAPTHDE